MPTSEPNPFSATPDAMPEMEMRRADLPQATRTRVDRFYAELKGLYAKYGVANIAEAFAKVRDRKIKILRQDIERMKELMDLMQHELQPKPPHPELEALKGRLKDVMPWLMAAIHQFDSEVSDENFDKQDIIRRKTQEIIVQRLSLESVPENLLLEDPGLCQKILESLLAQNDLQDLLQQIKTLEEGDVDLNLTYSMAGMLISEIYNYLAQRLPHPDKIVQYYDLTEVGPVGSLGSLMPAGKIIIEGVAGDHIGMYMEGGEIQVAQAGDFVGDSMRGGILRAGEVGNYFCQMMEGGRAYADKTGDHLGTGKTGGTITVGGKDV